MNNTALGAENKKEQTINFISEAHEKFYYEKLKEVRYQDVYHKALCYCLGISDDTRRNVDSIYDFKTGCVKTECLHEGWQTSGSMKVVRMAFNLYCNGRGNLRTEKQEMLSTIDRFLTLPPDERLLFTVGRRLNIFFRLDDLKKPKLYQKAGESLQQILSKNPHVDFAALCNYVRQSQI